MTAATLALLSACAQPQPPVSHIDRVQAGDNQLTCPQVRDQIAEMNKVLGISNTAQGQANSDLSTTGAVGHGAGFASSLANVPIVGGAIGMVAGQMQNQQAGQSMQAQQDAEDAKTRKENLVAQGNAKGCFNGK
jgi:hypothetical protein